ncbi:PEP-utilizing enzyme [Streptomycetaceae bacterium NBC_01309]
MTLTHPFEPAAPAVVDLHSLGGNPPGVDDDAYRPPTEAADAGHAVPAANATDTGHPADTSGAVHAGYEELAGRKAAALARAVQARLPVLPGVVLTAGHQHPDAPPLRLPVEFVRAVEALPTPWIVRSSSPDEDGEHSSRAGQFRTVRDVATRAGLVDAVAEVRASAAGGPMAVLVQPQLTFALAGVLFGADPITGADGMTVAATAGNPDDLVSGQVDGDLLALSGRGVLRRDGRRVRRLDGVPARGLGRDLARLAHDAARVFGGPQDIEWGRTAEGRLVLLQSRPITRHAAAVSPHAPLLGAGPLAETFPNPLWPLEADLWLPPMRQGLENALRRTGARLPDDGEPLVRSVGGHAVAVLEALGAAPPRNRALAALDPRPGVRRLRASARVGRLRAVLRQHAAELVRDTDALLAEVPAAPGLTEPQMVGILRRGAETLTVLHEYEALMGLVLAKSGEPVTAAGVALRVLAESPRPIGELVADEPVLLALVAPGVAPPQWPVVPAHASPDAGPSGTAGSGKSGADKRRPGKTNSGERTAGKGRSGDGLPDAAVLREALRLRARWAQELQAAVARELGLRLTRSGHLEKPLDVRELHLDELVRLLRSPGTARRADPVDLPDAAPLPEMFRLSDDGTVVAWEPAARRRSRGRGGAELRGRAAAPGRAVGTVVHDVAELDALPPGSAVLVTATLGPELAVHLPRLGALVSRTGSPLSHLAILAREHGIPTVVAVPGVLDALPPGTAVVVDGRAGTVTPSRVGVGVGVGAGAGPAAGAEAAVAPRLEEIA